MKITLDTIGYHIYRIKKITGIRIPAAVSHAPLPVIPFFPRIMKSPVAAINISARAKASEYHVHSRFGLL